MKTREGTKLQSAGRATTPEIVSGERIGDFVSKIHDAIAHRAYEFFEARGDERGHDLEDWFRAESELLHPVKVKTWQSEQKVYVNAEIPAFRAEDVKIGVEPRRVIILARSPAELGPAEGYPFGAPAAMCQRADLPAEIDSSRVSARLADGLLRLELPKVLH